MYAIDTNINITYLDVSENDGEVHFGSFECIWCAAHVKLRGE